MRWFSRAALILSWSALIVSCVNSAGGKPGQGTITPPSRPPDAGIAPSTVVFQLMEGIQGAESGSIAFVSDRRMTGNLDIWLADLDTRRMEPITTDDMQDYEPAWSPGGSSLAFLSFQRGKTNAILRWVNMRDRVVRVLVAPLDSDEEISDFVWAADGKSVYYVTYNFQTFENHVWRFDILTGDREQITTGFPPMAISADGQYLAIMDHNPASKGRFDTAILRVLRLADKKDLSFTPSYLNPGAVAWSPVRDIFAVTVRIYAREITTFAVNGEHVDPQADDSGVPGSPWEGVLCDAAWTPDGKLLAVVRSSRVANLCHGEIWVYDDALEQPGLFVTDALSDYPRWSPDGKWIAYGRNDTLNTLQLDNGSLQFLEGEIWIADSSGMDRRPLIKDRNYSGQPAWRP